MRKKYIPIVDGIKGARCNTQAEAIQALMTMVPLHPFNEDNADILEFPFDCAIITEKETE